jgi:putative membrane protein
MTTSTNEAGENPLVGRSANELAEERTQLAASRTLLAADRTLMAWIRTALSMMTFGFAIYRLLEAAEQSGRRTSGPNPRTIGLFLTATGTLAMIAGVVDYWSSMKQVARFQPVRLWRSSFVVAIVMAAGGLILFFSIVFRL